MRKLEVAGIDIAKSHEFFKGKKISFSRWPDVPRYYGVSFIRWAILADLQRFGYTGIDSYGFVLRYQGRLFRRWSAFRRKRNLALIYSFAESLEFSHLRSQSDSNSPPSGGAVPEPPDRSGVKRSDASGGSGNCGGDAAVSLYFCTLTVRHPVRHSYTAQKQAVEDLRSAWRLFSRYLRRGCFRYLRVFEAGEVNGFAHIHMIVSASDDARVQQIPKIWVRCCRKIGNDAVLDAQNLQAIDSTSEIRNVGAYISKYLSKMLESGEGAENLEFWRWMEVCYRLRLRTVSMDSASREYIRRKYCDIGVSGVAGEWMPLDVVSAGSDDIDALADAAGGVRYHPAEIRLMLDGLM